MILFIIGNKLIKKNYSIIIQKKYKKKLLILSSV